MTFRQLKAFVAVYEEGAFARAATREHATQSGLSMLIRSLEQQFGVRLFDRLPHGVAPTPAGRRYYERCLPILRAVEAANAEMREIASGATGRLSVGIMPLHARCTLAPRLARFAESNPGLDLHVVEGLSSRLADLVAAGDLDLAVVPLYAEREGIRMVPIGSDREMLVSGGRGIGLPHLAPVRLGNIPPMKYVLPDPQSTRRRTLDDYFRKVGHVPQRVLHMDSIVATFNLVSRTDWVTVMPGKTVAPEIIAGGLTLNPVAEPPLSLDIAVITPSCRELTRAAERCIEEIRAELGGRSVDDEAGAFSAITPLPSHLERPLSLRGH